MRTAPHVSCEGQRVALAWLSLGLVGATLVILLLLAAGARAAAPGTVTSFSTGDTNGEVAVGPNGNVWFGAENTDSGGNGIGRNHTRWQVHHLLRRWLPRRVDGRSRWGGLVHRRWPNRAHHDQRAGQLLRDSRLLLRRFPALGDRRFHRCWLGWQPLVHRV